jgi:signal transduction histidine kinase
VENAAKYSPADSEITIKAQLQNEELLVSVTDQGQGVLPDEIEHIFDKFYRGTQLSDTPIQGTGMGLAIARGIIEAHNGKIWAESKLGQGATFKFSIPIEYKNMAEFILTNGEL